MGALAGLAVVAAGGCGDGGLADAGGDAPQRCSGFVGDRASPVEVEAILTEPERYDDGMIAALRPVLGTQGARVPLIQAPQGGKHVFAGVRVRNLDTCPVRLVGTLRDTSGFIRFESRPVDMLAGDEGWAYAADPAQIGSYANIPVCPNVWSDRDIHEQPYELELRVSDAENRNGLVTLSVVPFCGEPAHEGDCRCSCEVDAVLGCACGADAGPIPRGIGP
jgi:hypothetical protein